MFWLPPLTIGHRSRLPLGHAAASAIAELLLAGPATRDEPSVADSAHEQSSWLVALSQDAGLLLWCNSRAAAEGADLQRVGQISDWFLAGGWRRLANELTDDCPDEPS